MKGRYAIDARSSRLKVSGTSTVHPIVMASRKLEGWVEMNGDEVVAGELTVPTRSLRSGNPIQDRELHRRIDARRHRQVRAVVATADGGTLTGTIEFYGSTVTVDGTIDIDTAGAAPSISGSIDLDVRDWGFEPPKVFGLHVHPMITVELRCHLTALGHHA